MRPVLPDTRVGVKLVGTAQSVKARKHDRSLRSGWTVPSCRLRTDCNRYPKRRSRRPTVVELTRHPCSVNAAASFAALAPPSQRRCRVAARQRIHEPFESRQSAHLVLLISPDVRRPEPEYGSSAVLMLPRLCGARHNRATSTSDCGVGDAVAPAAWKDHARADAAGNLGTVLRCPDGARRAGVARSGRSGGPTRTPVRDYCDGGRETKELAPWLRCRWRRFFGRPIPRRRTAVLLA